MSTRPISRRRKPENRLFVITRTPRFVEEDSSALGVDSFSKIAGGTSTINLLRQFITCATRRSPTTKQQMDRELQYNFDEKG